MNNAIRERNETKMNFCIIAGRTKISLRISPGYIIAKWKGAQREVKCKLNISLLLFLGKM